MELDKKLINLRMDVIERNLAEIKDITAKIFKFNIQLP